MIHKLRRRLTLIFSILTSLVLAAAVFTVGWLSCRQYEQGVETLFLSSFSALQDKLQNNDTLSDTWLSQQEQDTLSVIYIEDNGISLHFPGAFLRGEERTALIAQAQKMLAAQPGYSDTGKASAEWQFTLTAASGVRYRCAASLFSRGNMSDSSLQSRVLILTMQDYSAVHRHLFRMILLYAGLWLAGAAILSLLGWYLTGLALRPTQQALLQQNEFVAAASHELRSPLTVIKTSLEAARQTGGISAQAVPFLRSAENEADRMKRLTDDMLLLAGRDACVWRMNAAPLALDTFCIELYDAYYPVAKKQGHTLTLDLPDQTILAVSADQQRLRQLFAILLNNAFEYAPADTPVALRLSLEENAAVICVADHGRGIPNSEKGKVFRRFYRTDKSRTEKAHFGLGLSVAKEIAEMHHAQLTVQDTPGGGATFCLSLPLPKG